MASDVTLYFCLFLALWSAVIGGVFSAFSEFIMRALLRTTPSGGIEAMQHINRTVIKTQFVAGILLIAPSSLAFAVYAGAFMSGPAKIAIILAMLIYLPSVFFMTMLGNVPMNNRLDGLDFNSEEAAVYWLEYGRKWTRLNHLRSLGSIVTACLYLFAAVLLMSTGNA